MRTGRSDRGFTLLELITVMAVIGILVGIALPNYKVAIMQSREAVLKDDLYRLRDLIDQYYADKGKYPASLDALVSEGSMRRIPEDPITKSADTWQTIPAEPDPGSPSLEPGIYDVKSGAQGTALDGTNYSDW